MSSFFRKLSWLFLRRRKESELREEVAFHLDEDTEEKEKAGLSREDARRATRLEFGNPALVREDVRSTWSCIVLEQFWQDLSYAGRALWRTPGFTAGAIAVLALGIGANLALFQIFDTTFIHRYPIPDGEAFVRLSRTSRNDRGGMSRTFPSAAADFYRANTSLFASLISEDKSFTVVVDGTPARRSTFVSDNYFSTVGILPSLGRAFDQQDARDDAPAVALLSHQYWRTQFGADPQVLGRVLQVNDAAVQIVGVLPESFLGLSVQQTDLWFPFNTRRMLVSGRPVGQSELFGKLKPGVSVAAGTAELTALTRELARQQPRYFGEDDRIQADLLQESLLHFLLTRSPMFVIFIGMVALVLVSACAHLGNMLLVRGLSRQQELKIRIAIGASRSRLIRQLVTENVLMAILGGAAGLAIAVVVARLVLISVSAVEGSIHWQTVVACAAMTFASVFVFGLPSARETTRLGFQTSSLRSRFVANQVSVSCVLLIVTGVFATRNMLEASFDVTFDYRDLVVVDPQLYAKEGPLDAAQRSLDALYTRFSELPGVESVTVATAVPLRGPVVDNFPLYPRVYRSAVAPSFFDVLGLTVLRGRTFLPGEQNAVIASESAARSLWPDQDPLGQLWKVAGVKRNVVGVVQDSGMTDLNAGTVEAYLPLSTRDAERCVLILHTRGDPASVVGMIPRTASALDETVSVTTMREMRDSLQGNQTLTTIFGSISVVATALAAAGIFALMAFTVAQRTREIGIRIAIGATRGDLLWGLLKLHAMPLGRGVLKGAIAAVILLLFIRAVVFPERYIVFLGGLVLGLLFLAAVAALATLIPALRALRIDPSKALRAEG